MYGKSITKGDAGDSLSHYTPPQGGQISSFTFQEPSYDVVNIKFIRFSHRAVVLCASRALHGVPSFRDDL